MAWFWLSFFNIIIALSLFLYVRSSLKRALRTDRILEKVRSQIDELLRELNGATERNLNLVEIRMESLTALMEDAQNRMEVFDAQMQDWQRQREQLESLQAPEGPTFASPVNLIRSGNKIAFSIDQNLRNQASVVLGDRPCSEKVEVSSKFRESTRELDRSAREREALRLFNQGISLEMIAKKLKMDLGEVELIISLKSRGRERSL